ncbi:MAG: U32 family peptidase [Candidatus Omnitrophica bacterium]|nr:U32 family peptidase [Candidatus Omnitrophota bacterium]MDD5081499.1 U32 family peptidase [Candidatus Omnitrophota bacterium]MDD5441133.1 U32 family peptidase [Candidatus Omnitrophota bacterium]
MSCGNKTSCCPELVVPAGDWPSLVTAVESGANSVYFGIKTINMRNLAVNFELSELSKVVELLHKNRVNAYLALNINVKNSELIKISKILTAAKACGIDAIILWDKAVMKMALALGLNVHLSTQAGVSNKLAAEYYANEGVSRIVLARECSLADIKDIAGHLSSKRLNCGIEVFVHGAMCVSISGRCFLSQESFNKSANRGECLQPCRREFIIKDIEGEAEYVIGKDYLLSPKDLCTIEILDEIISAGVVALKIEGRNRAPEYVGIVTCVYRRAVDIIAENKKLTPKMKDEFMAELYKVYTRGFSTGFYTGSPDTDISRGLEHTRRKAFVGTVTKYYKNISVAEVKVLDAGFKIGDELIFIGKHIPAIVIKVSSIQIKGETINSAERGQHVGVKVPRRVNAKDKVFIWT